MPEQQTNEQTRVPTTGDRVRITTEFWENADSGGVIVSGPSEHHWFRIKLDRSNAEQYVYLFTYEFEVTA